MHKPCQREIVGSAPWKLAQRHHFSAFLRNPLQCMHQLGLAGTLTRGYFVSVPLMPLNWRTGASGRQDISPPASPRSVITQPVADLIRAPDNKKAAANSGFVHSGPSSGTLAARGGKHGQHAQAQQGDTARFRHGGGHRLDPEEFQFAQLVVGTADDRISLVAEDAVGGR